MADQAKPESAPSGPSAKDAEEAALYQRLVFVGRLPSRGYNPQELHTLLVQPNGVAGGPMLPVKSIQTSKSNYVFVEYLDNDAALIAAQAVNGATLAGSRIVACVATELTRLFVGGISKHFGARDIRDCIYSAESVSFRVILVFLASLSSLFSPRSSFLCPSLWCSLRPRLAPHFRLLSTLAPLSFLSCCLFVAGGQHGRDLRGGRDWARRRAPRWGPQRHRHRSAAEEGQEEQGEKAQETQQVAARPFFAFFFALVFFVFFLFRGGDRRRGSGGTEREQQQQ